MHTLDTSKEFAALLQLIDDPDWEVYQTVAERILSYGINAVPDLERLWEQTIEIDTQERIENLIHQSQLNNLEKELTHWMQTPNRNLLEGAFIVAKFKYPESSFVNYQGKCKDIQRNIWLELSYYLTPLEKINVINSIVYNYYKFTGYAMASNEHSVDHFFINRLLENSKGNSYSIGILYMAICNNLDIPIFAIGLPNHFLLGYYDTLTPFDQPQKKVNSVPFYIDPCNGMVYTQMEVEAFLRRMHIDDYLPYLEPLSNFEIICQVLEEMSFVYDTINNSERADELLTIVQNLRLLAESLSIK